MTRKIFRIGTRKSKLALIQAQIVCAALREHHPELSLEVITLETTGDHIKEGSLADKGGKGLFTKEIEQALLAHDIDLAVHSLKDMETPSHETGLMIGAVLPREDYRDILLSRNGVSLDNLPYGAKIGTCSPRRAVQIQRIRKDLIITPLRGNVDTRLKKLEQEEADAIILAVAGLKRLGFPFTPPPTTIKLVDCHAPSGLAMTSVLSLREATGDEAIQKNIFMNHKNLNLMAEEGRMRGEILEPPHFLPAVGQGVLALQIRQDDPVLAALIAPLNDRNTAICVEQERAMLAHLGGNCHTPIAGLATLKKGIVSLQGLLAETDGSAIYRCHLSLPQEQAACLGERAAWQLLKMQELCL